MNSLVLRAFKGVTALHFKKLWMPPINVASFHTSMVLQKGRRTGSKAHEPRPRKPSKKQRKRMKAAMESKEYQSKRDPEHHKMKREQERYAKKQVNSEEMKQLIANTDSHVARMINELKLPDTIAEKDYLKSKQIPLVDVTLHLNVLKSIKIRKNSPALYSTSLSWIERAELLQKSDGSVLTMDEVRDLDLTSNRAMKESFAAGHLKTASVLYSTMVRSGIPVSDENKVKLLRMTTGGGRLKDATELLEKMMRSGEEFSDELLGAQLELLVALNELETATKLFEERVALKPDSIHTVAVYIPILKGLINAKKYDEANKFWLRMHDNGLVLNAEAFEVMMKKCRCKGEAERAFFLFDEMRIQRITPTEGTLIALIDASGTAPHWVNGYQDTIFDALCVVEGCEFMPTVNIYNAIIRAFAHTGDAVAAEYYFWEMRRKGILPTPYTYDALMDAYATSQNVGAPSYGMYGRFVKPKPRELTKQEEAYLTLGPIKVAQIMSAGYYAEVQEEKGKRIRAQVHNVIDELGLEEAQDYYNEKILQEAEIVREEAAHQKKLRQDQLTKLKASEAKKQLEQKASSVGLLPENTVKDLSESEVTHKVDDFDEDPDLKKLMELMKDTPEEEENADSMKNALIALDGDSDSDIDSDDESVATSTSEVEDEEDYSKLTTTITPEQQAAREEADRKDRENVVLQLLHSAYLIKESNEFFDPFAHVETTKGKLSGAFKSGLIKKMSEGKPLLQSEKTELVKMLDGAKVEKEVTMEQKKKVPEGSLVTQEYVNYIWDMIEYGRAPDPDYDISVDDKRAQNIKRAEMAMKEYVADGHRLEPHILAKYVAVYGNTGDVAGAERVMKLYEENGLSPVIATYRNLIKLNILANNIDKALELKTEMVNKLAPDSKAFGLIIESLSHRGKIVESMLVLEEAASYNLDIPNKNLMKLRGRCETLGVYHPDLGEDPKGWVKDLKLVRKQKKHVTKRGIQQVQSTLF